MYIAPSDQITSYPAFPNGSLFIEQHRIAPFAGSPYVRPCFQAHPGIREKDPLPQLGHSINDRAGGWKPSAAAYIGYVYRRRAVHPRQVEGFFRLCATAGHLSVCVFIQIYDQSTLFHWPSDSRSSFINAFCTTTNH